MRKNQVILIIQFVMYSKHIIRLAFLHSKRALSTKSSAHCGVPHSYYSVTPHALMLSHCELVKEKVGPDPTNYSNEYVIRNIRISKKPRMLPKACKVYAR